MNADPQRDVLITGVTEQIQPKLKEAVERVGAVYSLKFHKSPKLKTLPTSVAFCNAGDGQKAVDSLNNEVVGGVKISVVLDDKGQQTLYRVVYGSQEVAIICMDICIS